MSGRNTVFFMVIAVALLIASNAMYAVKETERAVKLQFGEIVDADLKPGLGFKVPFIQELRRFDGRVLGLDAPPEEYLTVEKKRLIVDSFVMWRIKDVRVYYTAAGGFEENARRLLGPRVNEGLRNKFGQRSVDEVVSGEREALMLELTGELNPITVAELGIEVVDVRVKRIDLPSNVSQSVYDRMKAEREREAREHRSQGKEVAQGITADADREQRIILANSYKTAEEIRGEGDAEAAAIYAAAYSKDADFYSFYRSLSAYRSTFSNKGDVMLIDPKSEFFDYMKNSGGSK